jgi:hypothetical protein
MPEFRFEDADGNQFTANEVVNKFNKEFRKKSGSGKEMMMEVIVSHLIIEHYLDRYIQNENPNLGKICEVRVSFPEKIKLIKNPSENIRPFIPGINKLNKIRNHFAHNLEYEIPKKDFQVFWDILKEQGKEVGGNENHFIKDPKTGGKIDNLKIINGFSHLCSFWLSYEEWKTITKNDTELLIEALKRKKKKSKK